MPQLMPFYWVISMFIMVFVIFTLVLMYFYKEWEEMNFNKSLFFLKFYIFKW